MITAQSSMKNFALAEDVVSSFARMYIKSIREISYSYNGSTEKGVYTGEFVIDTSSLAKMAEAERALAANRGKPAEAGVFLFDEEGRA